MKISNSNVISFIFCTKAIVKFGIRIILRIFYVFPIKTNRIVFESWGSKRIGCSPLCLFDFLSKNTEGLDLVFCVKSGKTIGADNIRTVQYFSWNYFKYILTSKVYITNIGLNIVFPFRKEQIIVNTWHAGGAYKKIEKDFYRFTGFQDWLYNKTLRQTSKSTTYYLAAAEMTMKFLSSAWGLSQEKCIRSGLPRNDIFFHPKEMNDKSRYVRERLNIEDQDFVILYAPTFRNTTANPTFDWRLKTEFLFQAVENRFTPCKITLLIRMHSTIHLRYSKLEQKMQTHKHMVKDVSDYPEMQDLLCAADMLITDYSSSVWDYSFTYRPCFLFTPDLEEYKKNTGFNIPIEEWGFPICKTNEELRKQIEFFDENKFKQAMIRHHENLGSYEKGTATKEVAKIILSHIDR